MRRLTAFMCMGALALTISCAIGRDLILVYEGSFKLPTLSGTDDNNAQNAAYVPDGMPREAGPAVPGPSILVDYEWHQHIYEFNQLPPLSKTPAAIAAALTAVRVSSASNGTGIDLPGYYDLQDMDSAGNIYDTDSSTSSFHGAGVFSNPGVHMLGYWGTPAPGYAVQESGWSAYWIKSACLRRGDGSGGDLPTDGTAVGARFLYNKSVGSQAWVYEATRVDATNVTSTLLFKRTVSPTELFLRYVRNLQGKEYIMHWKKGGHSGDSFVIDFYDPAVATGGVSDPAIAYSLDIGPDIAAGAGWHASDSTITGAALDWDNSQLYVLDYKQSATRIHVFTATEPPPAGTVITFR